VSTRWLHTLKRWLRGRGCCLRAEEPLVVTLRRRYGEVDQARYSAQERCCRGGLDAADAVRDSPYRETGQDLEVLLTFHRAYWRMPAISN
jgi:hypothetical protein